MRIDKILEISTQQLINISDTPALDCEVLLLYVLNNFPQSNNYNRAFLRTWPEHELNSDQLDIFENYICQRLKGKPIAYITGFKEFWSLNLQVNKETLIPRPDTEILVEQALELIPKNAHWNILDLGTGSGAIALAIASEREHCHIFACDHSFLAISMAKKNALRLNITNCYFINAHWLNAIKDHSFQIIVSNPPYIRENDPHLKQTELQYEPITALTSTNNGLHDLQQIIQSSTTKLIDCAYLILEHGYDQANAINNLFVKYNYQLYSQVKDINAIIRVSIASKL